MHPLTHRGNTKGVHAAQAAVHANIAKGPDYTFRIKRIVKKIK